MIHFHSIHASLEQFFDDLNYSKLFILTDENTVEHCLPVIESVLPKQPTILTMKAGESHKTMQTCEALWLQMLKENADRQSFLLNVGGGVVTDLGGFLAGCYKRGIRFANIPTSLLAMVDASVGGKTGIDFGSVKNSIGLFLQPEAVFIDEVFLDTLPKRHLTNGKAEIIKHGLIRSNQHFHNFLSMGQTDSMKKIIQQSVGIKKEVVESDPTEKGLRKILNFGHTVGHAIEAYSLEHQTDYLLHGEAIALGMIIEAYLSTQHCSLTTFNYENIRNSIANYFSLHTYAPAEIEKMLHYLKNDKKNEGTALRMSLLNDIGEATFDVPVSMEDTHEAMKHIISNKNKTSPIE